MWQSQDYIVNNNYQQDIRVLCTYIPNKPFGNLLEISSKNRIFSKTFNSKFQAIEICFTDQNSQPLETENKINLTLIIKWYSHFKNALSTEPRDRIYVKGYRFLSFAKNVGTHATKVAKSMSNKYSQKPLDGAKNTTDAIKTASKRAIEKTAEATGDLIGNKIADKITSISKSPKEFHSQNASKELHSKMD